MGATTKIANAIPIIGRRCKIIWPGLGGGAYSGWGPYSTTSALTLTANIKAARVLTITPNLFLKMPFTGFLLFIVILFLIN